MSPSDTPYIEANLKSIQDDLADMKSSMSKIADALSKIAVLEERHSAMTQSLLKVSEKLSEIDKRQNALELAHVRQETTVKVSVKALQAAWGVLGAGVLYGVWQLIKLVAAQG